MTPEELNTPEDRAEVVLMIEDLKFIENTLSDMVTHLKSEFGKELAGGLTTMTAPLVTQRTLLEETINEYDEKTSLGT